MLNQGKNKTEKKPRLLTKVEEKKPVIYLQYFQSTSNI